MKIHFNNLGKSDNAIKVSFDGGNSFQEFNVNDIRRNKGIQLDDSQNYSKIKIIGKSSVLRDLDVVKDIDIPNNAFYLVVNSNYVKSIEYDGRGQESFSDGCDQDYFYDGCGQESYYDGCGEDSYYDGCGSDSYSVDDGYGGNDSSFLGNVEAILVSPLWLKNVFNVDSFDPEFLSIPNYSVQPFAYATDETPILYKIPYEPYNDDNFVCYDDGTTKKFFKVSPVESENVAKDYPKFQLFFEDELVYEEQTTYVDNIESIIQETIIDRHPDEFDGYDWKIYVNSEYYNSIMDKQFYMDSRYITEDYIIKIQDKQEHVYHYNAQYTEDNSRFSISWTKSTPALPDNPTKPFASFAGWYQDSSFSTPLNLGDVDRDGWIYAKWEYHDVTRKVIFEVPGLHLEFNVTRASNIELYMRDLISDIRNQDKNNCIKDISLVSSWNSNRMYFNTEEDFIIPANTFNVTFNKKTITLNYTDGTSKNFDYYNKPCTLGCKYEDILPTGEKSILQDCIIATSNSTHYSVIDSQESFEEHIASKNNYSVINLYENIINVSNLEIEYTNIDKSNDTINGSNSLIGLYRNVQIDAYISNEYIDSSNYETNGTLLASNIAAGGSSYIFNAFTKIKNLKNDKSIPGFRKIYLYCKPKTTTGQITFYYMNKSGSQVSKTASYNLGEDLTVPSTYEELDTMFSNVLSTSRYSYDIDTTVPNKNTYKIWMEHNNVKYYSGSTIHIPEIPSNEIPTNITACYLPVAINYDSTVKSLTKDLIGHSIEENVDAEISFTEKPYYSAILPTVKISDNSCTIVDIENCIRNRNNYIFRTPFEVPMKFTIKDNTFTQNFFFGRGTNDDAKNYILDNIETLQFYNGLGEELTTEQKQKILSLLPSNASSGQNRGVMLLEENLSNNTYSLPSIDYGRFVINKDQLDVYNLEDASADSANYVFYYGPDYDETFSDWVIPSTTKYVELYFDVDEERYYDRTLTKVCNITDTNKIRSTLDVVYHNVNPDTYNAYKDFFVNDKISYINILFNSSNLKPWFYNSSYNYYSSLNWINNVIAGDEVKIGNEVIKYVVSIDDMYYYKAKIENGKIQLTLDASNWFEYDTEKYQLSELISSSKLSISGDFYSRFNSTYYYSFNGNNKSIFAIENTGSELLYYPRATLSFDETLSYNKGSIYFENRSSNVIYGTDINLNNIKLCILYKKDTGTTFVPRKLKYCIVEADAVEEMGEPLPQETNPTDEPTGSEENQES